MIESILLCLPNHKTMYKDTLTYLDSSFPTNACLVTYRHKCGKANCRCKRGFLHRATALKYKIDSVQKMKYIRQADVESIRKLLYQKKGIEILERADKYIFSIATMFPELSGQDIHIKAYEVFGQQKQLPVFPPAN